MARIPAAGAVGRSGVQWGRWCRDLRGAAGAPPWGALGALGSGGGRGKGRARGAPADPPTRPCAPHGCNENTVTGTQHAWGGGVAHRDKKGGTRDTGWHPGGGGPLHVARGPPEPNGEGDLAVGGGRGGGRAVPIAAASKAAGDPRAHSCALPASPHLLPASFQYELPPPGTFPREAPPPCAHLHTGPASDASSPAPFAARPHLLAHRLPAGHAHLFCIQSPPLPRAASHPERSHLHTDRAPTTSPDLHTVAPPPRRPAHLGALRGAVGADELHEVLERVLPVVVADGGVGEVRPRLGQEGARREVQRRGCGPRAACGDPQCSGPPITSRPLPPEGLLQPHPSPTPRGGPGGGGRNVTTLGGWGGGGGGGRRGGAVGGGGSRGLTGADAGQDGQRVVAEGHAGAGSVP